MSRASTDYRINKFIAIRKNVFCWTEDDRRKLDASAVGDLSCIATRAERELSPNEWALSLNSHGSNTAPIRSHADYIEAFAK